MLIQVRGVSVHAMSGIELSRVRTEFRLRLPEPINKRPLESSGADIVTQSNGFSPYLSRAAIRSAATRARSRGGRWSWRTTVSGDDLPLAIRLAPGVHHY